MCACMLCIVCMYERMYASLCNYGCVHVSLHICAHILYVKVNASLCMHTCVCMSALMFKNECKCVSNLCMYVCMRK